MDQVQYLEADQPVLLARVQIGGQLSGDHAAEIRLQDGKLRLDAVAGLELQELEQRVRDRCAQVHQRIAPQAFRDYATVFFLLRFAGKSAQGMKTAARAPQPGIGVPWESVLIGTQLPVLVALRRTGVMQQPLHDAVLHQPCKDKDRSGLADEQVAGEHEVAHHDQGDAGAQPDQPAFQVGPGQSPARRQLEQRGAQQKSADQTQMRGMAGHRQPGQAGDPAQPRLAQPAGAKHQQPCPQDHHGGEDVRLHLPHIPGDAGQEAERGADSCQAAKGQPRYFGTGHFQDDVAGHQRLQDHDGPQAEVAAGQEQQFGIDRGALDQEDMAQPLQQVGAGVVENQGKAVPQGGRKEHDTEQRHPHRRDSDALDRNGQPHPSLCVRR